MITLGIETSCDETAVAILSGREILSNVVSSSMRLHKRYGGIVPEIATRHHVEVINGCLREALSKAGVSLEDIDLIAVTEGPGLMGSLLIGVAFAKALGYSIDKPVIGTNHVIAHLWANLLTNKSIKPPFVGLAVSGGHTALFLIKDADKYKLLGQTQDDAVGEAFDKVAKILGLGYPGGPIIEKRAKEADFSERVRFSIPSVRKDGSLDFSFSGIKTQVLYYVRDKGGAENLSRKEISRISCGFQEAVCEAVVKKSILACRIHRISGLVMGGGVGANLRLREKMGQAVSLNGIKLYIPPLNLCLDNAAMTAVLGALLFKKGARSDSYMSAFANFSGAGKEAG